MFVTDSLTDIFKVVNVVKENIEVGANSFFGDTLATPKQTGYKPIGIVGYSYNVKNIILYNCLLSTNTNCITYALNNIATSKITIPNLVFYVLYVRDI